MSTSDLTEGLTDETGGGTVGHTDNSVEIAADLDLVWYVTNDLESWPKLFSEYAAAEILEHRGATVRFRLTMHPDAAGRVWSWVSERTPDRQALRVDAQRVEPGPFEFMTICWTYAPTETGTTMRWVQDFRMRPDAPLDTAAMTERINANSVVQQNLIKDKVEALARSAVPPDGGEPAT